MGKQVDNPFEHLRRLKPLLWTADRVHTKEVEGVLVGMYRPRQFFPHGSVRIALDNNVEIEEHAGETWAGPMPKNAKPSPEL